MAVGTIEKTTLTGVFFEFVITSWMSPVPAVLEIDIPGGRIGIVHAKVVLATEEVKIISACCPEQIVREAGEGITSGNGLTVTV